MLVAALLSSCVSKSDFNDLKSQVDALSSNQIATLQKQIEGINSTIVSLQQTDASLKDEISALKAKDSELATELSKKETALSQRIDDLKTYVDEQLKSAKDWASATFSTIDQYQKTCEELAALKKSISDLKTELTTKIESDIAASEESIKTWVNEKLTGYWTIAETQSKLDELEEDYEAEDAKLQKQIDSLSNALADVKEGSMQQKQLDSLSNAL